MTKRELIDQLSGLPDDALILFTGGDQCGYSLHARISNRTVSQHPEYEPGGSIGQYDDDPDGIPATVIHC